MFIITNVRVLYIETRGVKMKVWIIHDSHYGNGEKLAQTLGAAFGKKTDVQIAHNKKVTPEQVVADAPDVIIVGTAARKFQISGASKRWLRKLNKILVAENKTIKYGASFLTHAMPKKNAKFWGERFHKKLANLPIENMHSEWISGRVSDAKGPFMDGEQEKFEQIAKTLKDWMK